MKVIRPVPVTGTALVSSTVPESDYPAWQVGKTYAIGERVMLAATHRIYESAIAANLGNSPASAGGTSWIDAGATNRWAMFDPAAGAATSTAEILTVTIAPIEPVDSIGFVDLIASYVRVKIVAAGITIYDQTQRPLDGMAASTTLTFLGLPAVAGAQITIYAVNDSGSSVEHFFGSVGQKWGTASPTFGPIASGLTSIGNVVIGRVLNLGDTEDQPTVGITDYSVRQTDDFGVTTIVPRTWAKKITARSRLESSVVDAVQLRLVDISARPALWIGEEGFEALTVYGFYKDFAADLQLGSTSYCTLTIEGLPTIDIDNLVADPAPAGTSDLQVIDPVPVTDAELVTSSVAETDAPAWAGASSYAVGANVLRQHRIYESLVDANLGSDPTFNPAKWLDVGPANRWAMFDQALGTVTTGTGKIIVTLTAYATISALAVLDAAAASVRVQAGAYDRTQAIVTDGAAAATLVFLDLAVPAGTIMTITISGAAADTLVSIGTLLIGKLRPLGLVEDVPKLGLTDYSTKSTDAFGNVSVVKRAWSKRMSLRAAVSTEITGALLRRFAVLRAKPALWIGQTGFDSLTIYGFFRDCSIEIGRSVSVCSLSIEGLSQAAPVTPVAVIDWENLPDTKGTKPDNNATNGADPNSPFGPGQTVGQVAERLETLDSVTIPAIEAAAAEASGRITAAHSAADQALANIITEADRIDTRIDTLVLEGTGGDEYDDTALRAEVKRVETVALGADVALGQRIDSVNATITTKDGQVRALIETKETAAVDRENAISQRIDSIVADGGGGDTDIYARSEITRVEQAAVLRDQALASRATTLEASSRADPTLMNANGNFSDWPDSRGTIPNGWGLAVTGPGATGGRKLGVLGRFALETSWPGSANGSAFYYAVSGLNFGDYAGGVDPGMFGGPGFYVAEADITLDSGSLVGSGLYCAAYNPAGVSLQTGSGHFAEMPANGGAAVGAGVLGKRYRFAVLLDFTNGDTTSFRLHPMVAWAGFTANIPAKGITWHRAGLRAATPQEIAAQRADSGVTAAVARIKATEDALADLPNHYATVQRALDLEASVGNVGGRIHDLEAITSNGTLATASRVEEVASYAGGIESRANIAIGTISSTVTAKTSSYVKFIADAGNGRATFSLWSDQYGGAWALGGDGLIDGNLTVTGTINTRAIADNAVTAMVGAQAGGTSFAYGTNGTFYGVSVTVPNPTGGPVRVDFRYSNISGGPGGGTFGVQIQRVLPDGSTYDFSDASYIGGIILDYPPAGASVTYRFKFFQQGSTASGGAMNVLYQQLFAVALKR